MTIIHSLPMMLSGSIMAPIAVGCIAAIIVFSFVYSAYHKIKSYNRNPKDVAIEE